MSAVALALLSLLCLETPLGFALQDTNQRDPKDDTGKQGEGETKNRSGHLKTLRCGADLGCDFQKNAHLCINVFAAFESSGLDLLATKPTISAKSNEENVRSTGSWCVSLTETYNWMTQDGTEGPCQCHLFNTKGTNSCDLLRHDMSTDASPHSHPYVQSCYRSCFPSEAMSCESRDQVHISTTPLEPKKASTGEVGQVVTLGHLNMLQTSETNAQPSPQPTSAKPTAQTSKPTIAKTSEPTSEPLPLTRGPTSPIELPTHHVVDATLATHTGASGMPTPHPTTWKSAWMWLWPNHGKNKKKKVVKADVPTSSPTMRTSVYNILTTMPMKIDVDPHESSRSIVPGDLQVPAEGKISSSRPTRYPTGGWLD